jgi:hypothetical protein
MYHARQDNTIIFSHLSALPVILDSKKGGDSMKRQYLVPVIALGLASAATLGIMGAQAQTQPTTSPRQTLVKKIAEKFNLKESDVQTVFDENRTEKIAVVKKAIESKLDQAVKDGKITEAQKQAIIAKQDELAKQHEANHEKLHAMTPEERKTAMDAKKAELEKWAKDNNIDVQNLKGIIGGPFGLKHGGKMRGGHGMGKF